VAFGFEDLSNDVLHTMYWREFTIISGPIRYQNIWFYMNQATENHGLQLFELLWCLLIWIKTVSRLIQCDFEETLTLVLLVVCIQYYNEHDIKRALLKWPLDGNSASTFSFQQLVLCLDHAASSIPSASPLVNALDEVYPVVRNVQRYLCNIMLDLVKDQGSPLVAVSTTKFAT
jgi:hypothetical protein